MCIYRTNRKSLILIGTGGHAESVVDSVTDYDVDGFVDEYTEKTRFMEKPVYKYIENVPDFRSCVYHVAIGDVSAREKYMKIAKELGITLVNIVHPSAVVSKYSSIGEGNYIGRLAVIGVNVAIGDNNIVNSKALIEHGCKIGNNCNISTNAVLNGDEIVEDGCFIGSNSVCKGQIRIKEHSVIGCGAACINDVDEYTTVAGVPAKVIEARKKHEDSSCSSTS